MNRKLFTVLLIGLMGSLSALAQNQVIGAGFTNGWTYPTDAVALSPIISGTYGVTLNPKGTGNQYFRMVAGGNQQSPSLGCVSGADQDISLSPETVITAANTNCTNGAYYINCPNTTDNYVFKTPSAAGSQFVYFRVQGTVRTVSAVSQNPSVVDYSQAVTVTATLSGALATGQAVYLRYTTSSWISSTVVAMAGAGTTYTGTIPAQATGTPVSYYVFTSGTSNVAANGNNADLYTINLNNNGGPNYSYTTSYVSAATGNWNTGATWVGGSVPPAGVTATIAATHNVTVDVSTANVSVAVNSTGTLTLNTSLNPLNIQASGSLVNNGTISANSSNILFNTGATLTNNGTFNAGTGTVYFLGSGTIGGSTAITFAYLNINGAVTISTTPTITNFLTMGGGSLTAGPIYAVNSSLIYNTGGATSRGNEWSFNGIGTAGSSPGYPFNISVTGGTTLDINSASGVPRACAGTLTINNGNTVNFNAMNAIFTAANLTVTGTLSAGTMSAAMNITNAIQINGTGAMTLSSNAAGDLNLGGSFTNNGTFTHNNRTVTINGSGGQSLFGTLNGAGATNCFYNLVVNKSASNLTLFGAVNVTNALTLTNGLLLTAGQTLTVTNTANTGVSGGNTASYIRGTLTWNIASNPGTNYVFPVGLTAYTPFTLNAPTGTLPVIAVSAFSTGPTGTADGTSLTALSSTEYWTANILGGSFTGSTVSLGRQSALVTLNVIGRSTTNAALSYAALGGTAVSPNINNSNNTGASLGYFVMAQSVAAPTITNTTSNTPTIAGQANNSGYYGQTININGTNFVSTGMTVTINGVAATSVTYVSATQLTCVVANTGAAATNLNLVVTNTNTTGSATLATFNFLGHVTNAAASYTTNTTWLGNVQPAAGATVTIAHSPVGLSASANSAVLVTVLSGATLNVNGGSGALTATTVTNNGTVTFSAAGSSLTATTFTNAAGGTLSWSAAATLNIAAGGTLSNAATVTAGTGTVNFPGAGTVSGTTAITFNNVTIAGGLTLSTVPTINGTLQIITGGFLNQALNYGNGSLLWYNTGGTYGRSNEWSATSGAGYPFHVQLSSNTTLNLGNGGAATPRQCAGNLTIDNGSTLSMAVTAMTATLTVLGTVNEAGNLTLSTSAGGDIYVGGDFTKTGGTFTCNARELRFTGSGTQTYNSNATENINFIRNSKTSGTLNLNTSFTLPTAGNTANFVAAFPTVVPSGVTIILSEGTVWNSSTVGGTVTINGTLRNTGSVGATINSTTVLTFGATGTYDHNMTRAASNLGAIPTATWSAGSNCLISGFTNPTAGAWFTPATSAQQSFSNFTWNTPGLTTAPNMGTAGSVTLTANGIFTMTSTGSSTGLRLGTNSNGTISCGTYIQNGGTIDLGVGTGYGTINCTGDFSLNSGTITQTGTSTSSVIQFTGSVNQNITIGGAASFAPGTSTISVRVNNAAGVTITNGTTLTINGNASTLYRKNGIITLAGTGVIAYAASNSYLEYDGTTTINTRSEEWPTTNPPANLWISNTAGVNLHAARTLTGVLTMNAGILSLGNFNLTLSNTASGAITNVSAYSATNMVQQNGTGQLLRAIATTGLPISYLYPVGETTYYTPITFNFSVNSISRNVGVLVVDALPTNWNSPATPTDYISRYWATSNSAGGSYSYTTTLSYASTGDLNGTAANLKISKYVTSNWSDFASSVAGQTVTGSGSMTEATADLAGAQLTARNSSLSYTWNGSSSSSWALASNWTPNAVPTSQDNITINVPGTNTLNITDARSITNLALSGTGTFNIASTGTLTVSGSFTNTSTAVLPLNADCASTVFFNSSGAQTIPALKFGNLNLVGGNRTLANGGTVSICGSYTPSAGTTTTTGNTVDFNGTAAQAILTNAANFRNLVISNTGGGTNTAGDLLGKNVTAGVNVNITNNLTINSGSRLDIGANTLTLTGSTGNTVSGYLRNAGTITGATAANLTFNGSGTYEHNFTTTAGTIPTANWTPAGGTSTCYVMGYTSNTNPPASNSIGQTFYNLTWECKNQASTCNVQFNVACPTINGNLNVLNTNGNIFRLQSSGTYNLTVKGDLVINSSTSNTTLNVNNTGTKPNIYLGGDLYVVQSSAIALLSSSSQQTNIVFNKASGTQKIYQTGDIQSPVCFTIGNGTTNTVQLQNDLTLSSTNAGSCTVTSGASLDFQNFILSAQNNYDFIVNSGGTLITANANGIYPAPTATGSVQNIGAAGTRQFNAAANYTYNGSSAQNTGTALTAAAKLTIDNSAGVTLDADVAISGTVVLTNGKLSLAAYHLTVPSSASITGYTAAKFIETSGTGELRIPVTTGSAIVFPVGNGTEYTPASFTFTSNSIARNLHVRAVKPRNTNDASTTDYINNRWWNTDLSVTTGNYAYSSSFTYISGDLVGTAANIRLNKWDGASWTEDAGSSVNTGLLTINSGSLTQATGSLAATAQWVGRKYNNQIYTWTNAVNGSWLTATNWTPNGIPWSGDGVIFNKAGSYTVSNMPTGITLTQFTVANSTLNVQSSAAGTLNISKAGPAVPQFSVASGASLTIDGSNAVTLNLLTQATGSVGGSLSLQKTTHKVTVGDANGLVFPSGGYFAGGSISNTGFSGNPFGSTGTNGAVIFQSGSICEAFEGANPFGTAITDMISTFNTGSLYRYSDPSVGSPSVSGRTYANFEFNANKTTSLTGANAFVCDNFTVTLGTLNLNITATPGHRIKGNIAVASGATLTFTPASAGTINLNSGSTQTISGAGTFTVNANSTLDIGAGTTVSLQKNMNVAGSGNININGTLVAVGENYIASTGTVTLNSGGILSMGSADGIQTGGAIGNVRNTTFTYNAGGHFTYSGAYNQNTGNRLPTTVTGNLTVANTGSSGNNTVTLTTTNTTVNNFNLTSGLFAAGATKQLNIATGGTVTATAGDFATGSTAGILNFPGSGTFTGSCNPYDVYLSGGVNFGAGTVTIQNGGSLRINTGGFANTNGPFYANGSTLLYNTGASFTAGTEWYALFTSGRGVPYDVQIGNSGVNNSILDFGTSTAWRYCRNNFYIGNSVGGTGYQFKLSSNSGGDLKIGGNWQRYANGSFTTNNRAVFFVGNGNTQTITANSGAETFAYFIVDKASGNVQLNNSPATTVTVNGSAGGNVLQLVQGDINLNGQTFNLGGAGGYFNVVGALRQVYSATAATFNVIGYKEITSTSSGTLKFDDQTTVVISNGLNFGPNVTTVNATLRIDAGGYADINAPIYGPNGILIYNTGGNYDRRVEWNGVEGTAGFPNDVIVNNSTLYAGGPGATFVSVSFGARRDVTINSAGSIIMNGSNMLVPLEVGRDLTISGTLTGSNSVGGDIYITRNWTRNTGGIYTHNNRTVRFQKNANSIITAPGTGETFGYLRMYKDLATYTVTCSSPVTVVNDLDLNTGVVNTTSTNLLTMTATNSNALIGGSSASYINGPIKRAMGTADPSITVYNANAEYLFPVGKGVAGNYWPCSVYPTDLPSGAESFQAEFKLGSYSHSILGNLIGVRDEVYWQVDKVTNASSASFARIKLNYITSNNTSNWYPNTLPCYYCNVVVSHAQSNGPTWYDAGFPRAVLTYSTQPPFIEARGWQDATGSLWTIPLKSFSPFGFGYNINQILPLAVQLLQFGGKLQGADGRLDWTVADSKDLTGFELQYSRDGRQFNKLVDIAGNAGSNYSYLHNQLPGGANFYRLLVKEKSGRTFYSNVVLLSVGKLRTQIIGLKENPVHSNLSVLIVSAGNQTVSAQVCDALGRNITRSQSQLQAGQNQWTINTQALAKGMYFVQLLTEDGERSTIRFIKD